MKKKQNTLLPAGFRDSLLLEAEQETAVVATLLDAFAGFGYRQVKPPMVEFEQSLLSGEGERQKSQSFRLLDPGSRHMMALRADMTMQIARIGASRLADEPRPLRLSYAGEVFRVQGEGLFADRAIMQAGAELIGSRETEADVEAITTAVAAIEALGVSDISIDLSLPALPLVLLEERVKKSQQKNVLAAVARRDYDAIKDVKTIGPMLLALSQSAGPADMALKALSKINLPAKARTLVEEMEALVLELKKARPNLTLTVDVLERRGFEYHTGVAFSIFSNVNTNELGRGGRYVIKTRASEEPATGFTLIVNNLLRILPKAKAAKLVYVPYGTSAKERNALRKKGERTVQGLAKTVSPKAEAKRLGCHSVFINGKIVVV